MSTGVDLFGLRPRAPRRVMMHAIDAGSFPDGQDAAQFRCGSCGADSGWIYASRSDVRRGVPCDTCNRAAA